MNWGKFFQSLGKFFSGIAQTFLANLMAALPILEQAAVNFLMQVVDEIIAGIASGAIPLPVFEAKGLSVKEAKLQLGKVKRDIAFDLIQKKLAEMSIPEDIAPHISDSLINWTIETSVRKYKNANSGNHGNFPGGNSGPVY